MNAPLAVGDPYGVVSETFAAPAAPEGVTAFTVTDAYGNIGSWSEAPIAVEAL